MKNNDRVYIKKLVSLNRDARTHDSFSHFDKHVRIIPIGFFSEGNNNLVFIAKFGCHSMI